MTEWNFAPEVIAKAQEIGIGDRVACHWSEAECQDQEGTVVGVEIHRRGKVEYTVHIDGDISPTDGFTHDSSGLEGGTIRMLSASPALPAVDGGEVEKKTSVLAREYRPTMDKDIVHAWGADAANALYEAAALISSQESRVLSLEEEVKVLREALHKLTALYESDCDPEVTHRPDWLRAALSQGNKP